MPTDNDGAVAPPAEAPDWASITEEIYCPMCEYNLRGLPHPRCPECGFQFAWRELLDPTLRRHPYLFEHHRERNIRAFLRTIWGTLRPKRFWSSLYPSQPSNPRRLAVYWVLTFLVLAVGLTLHLAISFFLPILWSPRGIPAGLSLWDWARILYRMIDARRFGDVIVPIILICHLGVIGLTWLTLLIFRQSMRRARVRHIHVIRSLVYSFDIAFWAGLAWPLCGVTWGWISRDWPDVEVLLAVWALGSIGLWLFCYYRLAQAYRHYLRFDHPFATVSACLIIVALVAANALVITVWI